MSSNVTVTALPPELTQTLLLGEVLAVNIRLAFTYVIYPCTSVLGIVGNVTSIVILTRQGFKKCSSILLLALAVSDVLFLIGLNRFPAYLYSYGASNGFQFSANVNFMLYAMNATFLCAYYIGIYSAFLIPVLITGERLLAIFCPLKVHFIVTPKGTVISILSIYILFSVYVFYRHILCLEFTNYIVNGASIGRMGTTDLYMDGFRSGLVHLIDNMVSYLTGIIPISLVTVGCVVIGTQIVIISNRRKQLVSGQVFRANKRTSKTTKTLFSICVLYIACNGFGFAFSKIDFYPTDDDFIWLSDFLTFFRDWLYSVNCVGDSIIYILANSAIFKHVQLHIVTKCWGRRNVESGKM